LHSANSPDVHSVEATKKALYECWKYNLGCHAYFSSGAARGAEIKRLPKFEHSQLLFNSLSFQLRSHKNMSHGQNFNEMVRHYLPPSASRRSIIWNLILLPALKDSGYHEPEEASVNCALSEMFQQVMQLPKPLDTKVNRDFISVLTDYIAPSGLAKTSTTSEMASQFHHSRSIHDCFYSADRFRRDSNGNFIRGPLIMAQHIWHALGEANEFTDNARPEIHNRILTKYHYDFAATHAYQNHMAKATDLQYKAINHAASAECNNHAFVLMGCGTGKSGIYNLLLLGAYLNACPVPRVIVISPHNSLLSQHELQSRQYLRGTNLRVSSMLPADVLAESPNPDFDLLFISIHAFNDLLKTHGTHILQNLKVSNIFIDEYHNVVGELFRFHSSWASLRLLAGANIKIMCLSATSDPTLMENIATFMGLGQYTIIGSAAEYPIPEVRINIITGAHNEDSSSLIPLIVSHCRDLVTKKENHPFKIHAITMTKDDANTLSDSLNFAGIESIWLTSELAPEKKSQVMHLWEHSNHRVLVSTFVDGIDNSATEDVIIVGATYSLYSLVQAIGRIRPNRQDITKTTVHIFHSEKYTRINSNEVEANISKALAGSALQQGGTPNNVAKYYSRLFSMHGYKQLMGKNQCIRRLLFAQFGIDSSSCNACSKCLSHNNINKSALQAKTAINAEEQNIQTVLCALRVMEQTCYVCRAKSCDGVSCRPPYSYCYACHGNSRQNDHPRQTCPVDHPQRVDTHKQSCGYCYMAISDRIANRGALEQHKQNSCPWKKRVKRVLLYAHENLSDKGVSARQFLSSALTNHSRWFTAMATNIQKIDYDRRNNSRR